MLNHKSEKIHHLLNKAKGKINLHEIKAATGAGNGFKNHLVDSTAKDEISSESLIHKSERIHHFVSNTIGKVNLHHLKAETGAGNGFKHHNNVSSVADNVIDDTTALSHKSEKIHHAVTNTEGKVNLHHIKAKTGAGSGFKHH